MYVRSVGKPLLGPLPCTYMKELTVARNLLYASNVGKPSLCPVPFEGMMQFIQKRNPIFVSVVGKLLIVTVAFRNMKRLIGKTDSVSVLNVRKLSCSDSFKIHDIADTGKKPKVCIHYGMLSLTTVLFDTMKDFHWRKSGYNTGNVHLFCFFNKHGKTYTGEKS